MPSASCRESRCERWTSRLESDREVASIGGLNPAIAWPNPPKPFHSLEVASALPSSLRWTAPLAGLWAHVVHVPPLVRGLGLGPAVRRADLIDHRAHRGVGEVHGAPVLVR